jgi:hypothetical protein
MKRSLILLSYLLSTFTPSVSAEVLPEIEISGKGVTSANLKWFANSGETRLTPDYSDSTLMMGLRQKLYSDWRSYFAMGVQLPDADSNLGDLFLSQTFLQLENQNQRIKVGRSNAQTSLVTFPTLRDDDALSFAYVLNPFSGGKNTQDHQYANVLEYSYVYDQRWWGSVHTENFVDFKNPNAFGINALGATLAYEVPASQIWNREILQYAGLSFYNFLTERGEVAQEQSLQPIDSSLRSLAAGLRLNVLPDPVHFIDLRGQATYNLGFSDVTGIEDYSDYTRANALATLWSLRYLHRRLERPLFQVSLSGGARLYPNNPNQSAEWIGLLNGFYRIGENLDLGLQYRYLNRQGDVKSLLGGDEHRVQLALVYSFDMRFFDQFDDRNSLLNLEHSYLK